MTLNGLYVSRCRLTDETRRALRRRLCFLLSRTSSSVLKDSRRLSVNSPSVWIYWYKDCLVSNALMLFESGMRRERAVFKPWLCPRLVLSVFTLTRTRIHDIWHERTAACSRRLCAHMADALSLHPSLCHVLSTPLFHLLFCLFVHPTAPFVSLLQLSHPFSRRLPLALSLSADSKTISRSFGLKTPEAVMSDAAR